jgi:adenine phosphoribosyltransferase
MGARPTGWWADASILRRLGPVLAELFTDLQPTLVIGPQSRGTLLGALVAVHLGVGWWSSAKILIRQQIARDG